MNWLKRRISKWLELDKYALVSKVTEDNERFLDFIQMLEKRDRDLARYLADAAPRQRQAVIRHFQLREYYDED